MLIHAVCISVACSPYACCLLNILLAKDAACCILYAAHYSVMHVLYILLVVHVAYMLLATTVHCCLMLLVNLVVYDACQ